MWLWLACVTRRQTPRVLSSPPTLYRALANGRPISLQMAEEKPGESLKKYGKDLTEAAREGKLDPVIGRDEEIRRTIQVLARRTKNNPVLIGEPGVGKTAIVEGLAQRIVKGEVPESLKDKSVVSLDLGTLVAGASYRGEFEQRLKAVMKDVQQLAGQTILFIDELHMLVGAGAAEGSMDASNMLKPALSRGELHCVGATTLAEYRKYIEKDAALARRFQTVLVTEPTVEDTISILRGLKEKYEVHHGVRIADSALVAAAVHSFKYMSDRKLPDKAIDLVDEAASRLRLQQESKPEEIDNLERSIITLKIEREALKKEKDRASKERLGKLEEELTRTQKDMDERMKVWEQERQKIKEIKTIQESLEKFRTETDAALRHGNWERASQLRYQDIPQLEQKLKEFESSSSLTMISESVTEKDVLGVIAKATGIPVQNLLMGEKERLLHMEELLSSRVVGQDQAIRAVSNAIRLSRAGLHSHSRPMGCFLMLGPTGVGKTELCKALSQFLFNDEAAMCRLDMSEYMERFSTSRLIGAPPGYVGYEEGGTLTESVRRRPYQLVLFDEFEKAHRDVANLLLQIMDEGHLTDSQGRKVDFKNTIVILTSNLGADLLSNLPESETVESARDQVMQVVRQHFSPEFLNRLDEIVLFNRLSRDNIGPIVDLQVNAVSQLLTDRRVSLVLEPSARELLCTVGYDPVFGARPVRRAVQHLVLNPLARKLLEGQILEGSTVTVRLPDPKAPSGETTLDFHITPPEAA